MLRYVRALRRQRGQGALEAIIVFPMWLVLTSVFINLLFYLGSTMLIQASVNRAALQASSVGCLREDAMDELRNRTGLGVRNVEVVAGTPVGAPTTPGTPGAAYYRFNKATVVDANGNIIGRNAVCSRNTRDVVENGRWIYMRVRYQQNLWLFGSRTVSREALVISHSLNF